MDWPAFSAFVASSETWCRLGLVLVAIGCYGALIHGIGKFCSANRWPGDRS